MADKSIQMQDPKTGENVYPITITDNIYLPNGTPLMKYLNSIPLPLGVVLTSTSVLTNAGLHLADGGEIMIGGVYDDFCKYVIANQDKFPIFYDDAEKTALEKWQEEFATYGQCTHYVITDTYIKLPYLTKPIGGVGSNLTDLGKINEAGLPDIEGSVGKIAHYPKNIATLNGAFYSATRNDNAFTGSTSESGISTIHFKASKSNPIYGNSATVEIEYPKLLFYIVVATVTKTDIEVNIDNIVTELNSINNKIKTNLLWENANPTASFSAQTITLTSSDYDYLMVIIKTNATNELYVTRFVEKGITGILDYAATGTSSGYYIMAQYRTMTYVNDTKYTISANTYGRTGGSATDRQDLNVPYKIYGFKRG